MSQEQKNNIDWAPTASAAALKTRAGVLRTIRDFFHSKGILEVETPILANCTVTEPHIASVSVPLQVDEHSPQKQYYLQTSPEYAMKRLLAAGLGSIYQICKAFRAQERGRIHNTEFTMLEWYRVDADHHQLMDDVEALLDLILDCGSFSRLSYAQAFEKWVGLNPHTADITEIIEKIHHRGIVVAQTDLLHNRDVVLQLLLTHVIEPLLISPTFIYDYPASQAALSRISQDKVPVAQRFEVYLQGIEIANGFHELTDFDDHVMRFAKDNSDRSEMGLPTMAIDNRLLAAIHHGLPSCAGVALGLDRVVMLKQGVATLAEVITFPTGSA